MDDFSQDTTNEIITSSKTTTITSDEPTTTVIGQLDLTDNNYGEHDDEDACAKVRVTTTQTQHSAVGGCANERAPDTWSNERSTSAMDISLSDAQTGNVEVTVTANVLVASIENNQAEKSDVPVESGGKVEPAFIEVPEPKLAKPLSTPSGSAVLPKHAPSTTTTQPTSINILSSNGSANKAQTAYLAHNGRIRKVAASNLVFKEENIQTYTDANGIMYKISGTPSPFYLRATILHLTGIVTLQIMSTWTRTSRTSRSP